MRRWAAVAASAVIVAAPVAAAAPARAIGPPQIMPGPPPVGPVAPPDPTEQKTACGQGAVLPGTQFRRQLTGDRMLNYVNAWKFSLGEGQKVAVIDTGVAPNPRLPALQPGGDYVSTSDGLVDCDAHGTLVAGLIAGSPSADDGFAGVAPAATIVSIRQNSSAYATKGASAQNDPNATSAGYGNTRTLALAIVHAVDLGATVINLSEAACAPVGTDIDDGGVGQAVRFAFERNVVVVAAAGNVGSQGLCSKQNDVRDPNRPRGEAWASVSTVASPAWFSDFVLTVGAVGPDAEPADFSLHGPWVGVAAPGEELTSLSPNGPGLINAWLDQNGGMAPINGTSFAAPFVSGLVALVRSRFPDLSAADVIDRIKRTAQTPQSGPNSAIGYGVIDPIAALTRYLPPVAKMPRVDVGHRIAAPSSRQSAGHRARDVTLVVLITCGVLAGIAVATIKAPMRR